ncbi:DUF1214 domain-containing protein [Sphingobium estronivorans]|uniref:DUF1214 domain-containing protein n=1 Tax=Sphingobium estronivorans TaxID=1577690 RepID=UPI00123B206E|nr:DUF1214 domain-containing protein [Sphingobium estronivorans]
MADAKEVRLSATWRDFCERLAQAGEILDRPDAPGTAIDQAEGLRYLSRLTRTALNMLVDSSDPDFPRIFLLSDDAIKIGADNPDNLYQQIVVRGDRDYRITGTRNSVPYFSIGSKANRYAIDGTMASTGEIELADMEIGPDGRFEIIVSKTEKPGNWLPMADDTTLLIIRQTFNDKRTEVAADVMIERISQGPAVPAILTPETIDAQLNGAAAWVRGTANTFADWSQWFMEEPNRIYAGKEQSFYQRAGGDPKIWYGHIYYDLAPDEALVITAKPPECRFWNFQIDNWWMESMDHVNRKVWVNGAQARYEEDGSVVVVCADRDPGYGNWIDLSGHRSGTGLWRWIEATDHPVPQCKVVKL